MNILIIDQCSKKKNVREGVTPLDAETIDNNDLQDLRERSQAAFIEAEKLYAGRQQQFISDAVNELRAAGDRVDRYFISAGFGCVEETEPIPPYNVTFTDYTKTETRERGEKLAIEADLRELVGDEYDVIFFSLGTDYCESFDLSAVLADIPEETWVVCFNQDSVADSFTNTLSLSAGNDEADVNGTIALALKGKYLQYFARHRSGGQQISSAEDIEMMCTTDPARSKIEDFE